MPAEGSSSAPPTRLTTAGRVENHMTLVEGGTGTLDTEGTVDLRTGALQLAYVGDIRLQ